MISLYFSVRLGRMASVWSIEFYYTQLAHLCQKATIINVYKNSRPLYEGRLLIL